jgi:hypothetical protein
VGDDETQGEMEAIVCEGMTRFEQDYYTLADTAFGRHSNCPNAAECIRATPVRSHRPCHRNRDQGAGMIVPPKQHPRLSILANDFGPQFGQYSTRR